MELSARPSALQAFPVVLRLPIQWGDLDAFGHVNNVVYLKWFEAARAVYATRVGVSVLPRQQGLGAVLASISFKYLSQLSYPGEVFSAIRVTRLSIGSVTLECKIVDARTGVPVAEGTCDAVLYDYQAEQPVAVPDHIRAAVEALEGQAFHENT